MFKRRFLTVIVGLALVATLLLPGGVALAGHRIQDTGSGTVTLDRTGDAPEQATGTAKFRLKESSGGYSRIKMELKTHNLPERAGKVYEVWLKDNDTDYDLSMGVYRTDNDGDGSLTVSRSLTHLSEYDEIVVTEEPKNDSDPTLNGPVLLQGSLH